jgi:hypothetical protein
MKKLLVIALAGFIAAATVGCGGDKGKPSASVTSRTLETKVSETKAGDAKP